MARRTGKSSKVPAVYIVAARSPERPSVAGAPPERGEPVVWNLMIKSNAPRRIFILYFRNQNQNKLLDAK